jgi:hypothetical protein
MNWTQTVGSATITIAIVVALMLIQDGCHGKQMTAPECATFCEQHPEVARFGGYGTVECSCAHRDR